MIITLGYKYTENGVVFDLETFHANVDGIKAFFSCHADVAVNVVCGDREKESDAMAIRCMMNDINNQSSFTFKCLSSVISAENILDTKVQMLKCLLEAYFPCVYNYNARINSAEYAQYASYFYEERFLAFKYLLPANLVQKSSEKILGDRYLDLSKLSADELATYVIPQYYNELGAWDRESIRIDEELMEFLSIAWFMQAKHGVLD